MLGDRGYTMSRPSVGGRLGSTLASRDHAAFAMLLQLLWSVTFWGEHEKYSVLPGALQYVLITALSNGIIYTSSSTFLSPSVSIARELLNQQVFQGRDTFQAGEVMLASSLQLRHESYRVHGRDPN